MWKRHSSTTTTTTTESYPENYLALTRSAGLVGRSCSIVKNRLTALARGKPSTTSSSVQRHPLQPPPTMSTPTECEAWVQGGHDGWTDLYVPYFFFLIFVFPTVYWREFAKGQDTKGRNFLICVLASK